jgi:integrase
MCEISKPPVKVAMETAIRKGCRIGDVLKMRWEDIQASVFVDAGKTGREYHKVLSPRRIMALSATKTMPGHRVDRWDVRNRSGDQIYFP